MRIRPLIFGLILAISALGAPALAMAAKPAPQVRVDQVGYTSEQSKVAWLLAARRRGGAKFRVETRDGTVVLEGRVGRTKGPWSDAYRSIHPIDISALPNGSTQGQGDLGSAAKLNKKPYPKWRLDQF